MSEVKIVSFTTVVGPVGPVAADAFCVVVALVVGPTGPVPDVVVWVFVVDPDGPVAPADADDILTYSLIR